MEDNFTTIVDAIQGATVWGLAIMTYLANLVPGIPEDAFLIVMGYMVGTGFIEFEKALLIVIPVLLFSDSFLYVLSRKGVRFIHKIKERIFSRFQLSDDFLQDHLVKVVFFSRFVFQLRFLGPFFAGVQKMPYRKFILWDLAALLVYVPVMFLIGIYFQDRVSQIVQGASIVSNVVMAGLGLFALLLIIRGLRSGFIQRYLTEKVKSFFGISQI